MTREKIPLSDYLFRIGVALLLVVILLALMLWVFNATVVSDKLGAPGRP